MAKITGNMVGVPNPQSDWDQTGETKADYVKNKPPVVKGEGEVAFKQKAWEEEADNLASGKGAVALGGYNKADGKCSMAANYNNEVNAPNAFAANSGNIIPEDAEGAFVTGHQNRAKSTYQTIGGAYSEVEAEDSFVIGNGSSETDRRNAFKVTKNGDVIAGAYGDVSEDDALVIGNGTSKDALKNAFKVKKNGDVEAGGNVIAKKANVDGVNARNISVTNNITADNKITAKELEVKSKASLGSFIMSEKNTGYGENTVEGKGSAALGGGNNVLGILSAAIGRSNTIPEGLESVFVAGYKNTAATSRQFVFGVYANPTASDMVVVGNGGSDSTRKNAFVVKRNGDAYIGGTTLTIGSTPITEKQLISLLNGGSGGSVDLSGYVKDTDYATDEEAGVVRIGKPIGDGGCGLSITEDGRLMIFEAGEEDINDRTRGAVITSGNIEYAVKFIADDRYSNPIKKTLREQSLVVINDISPLDSTVKIKASDNTVTDLTKLEIDLMDKGAGVIETFTPRADGTFEIYSFSPGMGIVPRSSSTIIDVEYTQDANAFAKEISADLTKLDNDVNKKTNEIEAIAKGRATGYVFDTLDSLEMWLGDEDNVNKLVLGDNLYVRAIDVPDYWWDGESKQQLETQKVDLSEYVKGTDYATEDKAGVVKVKNDVFTSGLTIGADGTLNILEAVEDDFGSPFPTVVTARILGKGVRFYGDHLYATKEDVGDISSALDAILAIQETIVGGVN